jgi:hypothetical protein
MTFGVEWGSHIRDWGGFGLTSLRSSMLYVQVCIYVCIVACTAVSRQRLGKHVPAATDTHATIEVLLEMVFSVLSVPKCYNRDG